MKKHLVTIALGSLLLFSLTGCGGGAKPQVLKTNKADKIIQKLSYDDIFSDKEITVQDIELQLFDTLKKAYQPKLNTSHFNNSCKMKWGKEIDRTADGVELNVYRGKHCIHGIYQKDDKIKADRQSMSYMTKIIKYSVKQQNKNKFVVTATYPTDYIFKKNEGFTSAGSVENPESYLRAFKYTFDSLSKPISFLRTYKLKNEIVTTFPDKSVYANFVRKLGQYEYNSREKISEVKKKNTFNFKFQGRNYPLYVEVYPYQVFIKSKS